MAGVAMLTARPGTAIARRQSNFIHQALITLSRLRFDLDEYVANILNDLGSDGFIEERRSQNFENQSGAASMVAQNVCKNLVIQREEQRLKNHVTRFKLI